MSLRLVTPKTTQEIVQQLETGRATFFHSSRTSTVIPYEVLEQAFGENPPDVADLSHIPGKMQLDGEILEISGAVTWSEAKAYCLSHGREVMTSPTEELANVLAGLATSCTGERCFGFEGMRQQIVEIEYLDPGGQFHILSAERDLADHAFFVDRKNLLTNYAADYSPYSHFKNAPFPRFQKETDLMIGTEGQLGVITRAKIKTTKASEVHYIFLLLPRWEEDFTLHLEVFEKVQAYRQQIFACEMIDWNSLEYLPEDKRPCQRKDLIYLEIDGRAFEQVYRELLGKLSLSEEEMFEIPAAKVRELRMNVPRAIFEVNARMGVTKKGTDVQVSPDKFQDILAYYKNWTDKGVKYNLFGHFGDAHLHFNFMPDQNSEPTCQNLLVELYQQVIEWHGSPFAEHGIGLIKQKFITDYYGPTQKEMFTHLKGLMDPDNQLFPQGFMNAR